MRHIISMLMQNEAGALVRVAGMFSQRGFNIETLNVAPTEDPTVSRLTLVTTGTDEVLEQINRQLLKLVDVIDVLDMTGGEHIERELLFAKAAADDAVDDCIGRFGAETLDDRDGGRTIQFIGTGKAVDELVSALAATGRLREVIRSGAMAVTPGEIGLRYQHSGSEATT